MAERVHMNRSRQARRLARRVSAREFWHDARQLIRSHGARIWVTALPFGMATLWLEQTALRLYPATIKDQRAAALLSFYGSLAIGYLAYAAIAGTVVTPTYAERTARRSRWRHWSSVVFIAALGPLGTIAGLAAALVPGVILWLSWVLAGPAAAVTGLGSFRAMRWSARTTWGSRRSLFYVFAAVHLTALVISGLTAVAMGQPIWAPLEDTTSLSTIEAIVGGLVESLQLAASGAICCAAYQRLSNPRD